MLGAAVDRSFNSITVDGDTSTNDACVLLASGASGIAVESPRSAGRKAAVEAVQAVCAELAEMIVRDGEGATKLVRACSPPSMRRRSTPCRLYGGTSPLVKTALFASDPNWGVSWPRSGGQVSPGLTSTVSASGSGSVHCQWWRRDPGYTEEAGKRR